MARRSSLLTSSRIVTNVAHAATVSAATVADAVETIIAKRIIYNVTAKKSKI